MAGNSKYILSFNAASLRLIETIKIAKTAKDNGITDLKKVRESGVVFNSVKSRTSVREFREIRKRLERLTPEQLDILINGDLISQKQIAFLGVCKHYDFIRDFTIEVIRNKALVYDYKINESDFVSFINNRLNTHPELEEFSETTLKKARQVLFHILEQVGIINSAVEKVIQPQIIQPSVLKAVAQDDRTWLRIFMIPEKDIQNIKY